MATGDDLNNEDPNSPVPPDPDTEQVRYLHELTDDELAVIEAMRTLTEEQREGFLTLVRGLAGK